MAHDTHFLSRLQRLGDQHQLDLALGLYRDPRAVRIALDAGPATDSGDRIALALGDGPEAAHVIVARDGGFVTCLGPGMGLAGRTIVPRVRLEEALDRSAAVGRADARIRWRGGMRALLDRLLDGAHRLAREDFDALYTIAPMLRGELGVLMGEASRAIHKMHGAVRRRDLKRRGPAIDKLLHSYGLLSAMLGHLFLLEIPIAQDDLASASRSGRHIFEVALGSMLTADSSTVLRSATYVAALGPAILDGAAEAWRGLQTTTQGLAAVPPLLALGARHPALRGEIQRLMADHSAPVFAKPDSAVIAALARGGASMLGAVDDAERATRETIREVLGTTCGLDGEALPDHLIDASTAAWSYSLLHSEEALMMIVLHTMWAGRRDPADYYLPAAHIDLIPNRLDLDVVRSRMLGFVKLFGFDAPVRVEQGPGRNAPCPCGSGRKFKRCCLGRDR